MSKRAKFWLSLIARPSGKKIHVRTAALEAAEAKNEGDARGPTAGELRGDRDRRGRCRSGRGARGRSTRGARSGQRDGGWRVHPPSRSGLVVERDFHVADAQLVDARKKLALLNAGSRAEDIAEAKARRDGAAAFLSEGKADLDQCSVRAPAAGTVKIFVTVGQFVSTYAPATLIQLTLDAN